MKTNRFIFIIISLIYTTNSISQNIIIKDIKTYSDSCDYWNQGKNGNYNISDLKDLRLKQLLKKFYVFDDSDNSKNPFIVYNCLYCDSLSADFKIDSGLANGYAIKFKVKQFDIAKHKVNYNKVGDICQIDNKAFFGVGINLPKQEISKFKIKYFNKIISINPNQFNDLFDPFLTLNQYCRLRTMMENQGEYFLIILTGGNDGLWYNSIWIFNKDKYIGRVIGYLR